MKALIPPSPDQLAGPYIETGEERFHVMAEREKVALLEFFDTPKEVSWFHDFELLYAQKQHDPSIVKILRKATEDERKLFRIPVWIQSDEVPECCGQPMFFVGQIDDDYICTEAPEGAKLWWHDAASFYVFTCPRCLECKAVGQQF